MTQLSSSVNDDQLTLLITNSDKIQIADFILERFSERYIIPIENLNKNEKHGFSIMAISCLMIESLESFKNGWETSKNRSEAAFKSFFNSEPEFSDFRTCSSDFYKNVRCGILHQSETTNGWKIRRDGELLKNSNKTINASKFLIQLKKVLISYTETLKTSEWDSANWDNLRRKLRVLISNCG